MRLPRLMSDIPNQAGFRLLGVPKNHGLNVSLTVRRFAMTGCHYLVDDYGARWPVNLFSTWLPVTRILERTGTSVV